MRQLILPGDWDGGPSCVLSGEEARYVGRVLRMAEGSSFPARDAAGRAWLCRVTRASPGIVELAVEAAPKGMDASSMPDARGGARTAAGAEGDRPGARPPPRIALVQGLLRGPRMDLVVRQAAEAGVVAVIPLVASRSLPAAGEGGARRAERWSRIVREARQQSGSAVATAVAEPVGLDGLDGSLAAAGIDPASPRVLLHEAPLAQSSMHGYLTEARGEAVVCVGPEGGFAPSEVEALARSGFRPLRLDGAVLRAETAALYAVAAAQIVLSERSSWNPEPG
jgi:16S rRNA (uracil1498-N3)-methyltransferase